MAAKEDKTSLESTADSLLESILNKIKSRNQELHETTLEQITDSTKKIVNQLGEDFVKDKHLLISEQLTTQILNNKSAGSKLLSKIGMGKTKIKAAKLNKLITHYIVHNKKDAKIYDYEKNILSKIKSRKLSKRSFVDGIKKFVQANSKQFPANYRKRLLALNENNVGNLTKAELSSMRSKNKESFDKLVLTPNIRSKKPVSLVNMPLKIRRAQARSRNNGQA